MLRNEIFDFSQLGTFVERADNTARILDVKYYVLLPSISWVGSSLDNYQWESILRSVSAHRSYRWVYEADYRPTNIADYLILNGAHAALAGLLLPLHRRSICEFLGEAYGARHPCHETVEQDACQAARSGRSRTYSTPACTNSSTSFIRDNNRLGDEIAEDFRFY